MAETITFERTIPRDELEDLIRKIEFRGLYNNCGQKVRPYEKAKFSLVTIYPPDSPTDHPRLMDNDVCKPLFTAQPTIYKTQTDIMFEVDEFLKTIDKRIYNLDFEAVQYHWEGRGKYHTLPPIIEKQRYPLNKGMFDLDKICEVFSGTYVKDARGHLHELSRRFLRDYYVDDHSKVSHMDIFNPSVELINYGQKFNGTSEFCVICDGSHRMDYALEILGKPITAILVEGKEMFPYYAFPMPFMPLTRLTSKKAEKMYPRLERDKIHLFNDFLKKTLHYNWMTGGLHVSKLRGRTDIF